MHTWFLFAGEIAAQRSCSRSSSICAGPLAATRRRPRQRRPRVSPACCHPGGPRTRDALRPLSGDGPSRAVRSTSMIQKGSFGVPDKNDQININ